MYILSFDIKEQLKMMLQSMKEVNRERTLIAVASSVHDLTRQNGIITIEMINLILAKISVPISAVF